jgi:hypothetical protein
MQYIYKYGIHKYTTSNLYNAIALYIILYFLNSTCALWSGLFFPSVDTSRLLLTRECRELFRLKDFRLRTLLRWTHYLHIFCCTEKNAYSASLKYVHWTTRLRRTHTSCYFHGTITHRYYGTWRDEHFVSVIIYTPT